MINTNFFKNVGPFTLSEVCGVAGIEIPADHGTETIMDVAPLDLATKDQLSCFHNPKYLEDLKNTKAGFCLLTPEHKKDVPFHTIALITQNPYRAFGIIANMLYPQRPIIKGISPHAVIHPSAKIGENCHIGAFTEIGENTHIEEGCYIGSHVIIGDGVKIGKNGWIDSHVTINHSIIGDLVRIKTGARIGQPGFGFHMDEKGHFDVPQLGCVIIGNNVQIGANTTIDRGSQNDTIIRNGVRIDNLVQIAHNVEIGDNSVLVAQVGIAGSTKLGKFVIAAGQAGIAGHLVIGDGVKIAAQSGLMRHVESGQTVGGSPAVPIQNWHRQTLALQRLIKEKK